MLLGLTEQGQERNRILVKRRIGRVTAAFWVAMVLPVLIFCLFGLGLIPKKSSFGSDIQEPVAKVITNNGVGTAFLVNPTTLLTARHVVEDIAIGGDVDLFFEHAVNQNQIKGKVKFYLPSDSATDPGNVPMDYFLTDFAVIEVPEITDIVPLTLGESDAIANLDEVILIGYPNGDYSISKGNINSDKFQGFNLFKLDATSNPGNSGGPCILKDDNTVIGILVGGSGPNYQGENISLKINDVKRILLERNIGIDQ